MVKSKKHIVVPSCQDLRSLVRYWSRRSVPDGLKKVLLEFAGIDDSEGCVLSIPLKDASCRFVGTTCGRVGNSFLCADVVQFLLRQRVQEVVGVVYMPDSLETYKHKTIPLCAAAITLKPRDAQRFECIVEEFGSSLHYDSHYGPWALFESE